MGQRTTILAVLVPASLLAASAAGAPTVSREPGWYGDKTGSLGLSVTIEAGPGVPISEWEKVMPGYFACVDEPASYDWKQLSRLLPEALSCGPARHR